MFANIARRRELDAANAVIAADAVVINIQQAVIDQQQRLLATLLRRDVVLADTDAIHS